MARESRGWTSAAKQAQSREGAPAEHIPAALCCCRGAALACLRQAAGRQAQLQRCIQARQLAARVMHRCSKLLGIARRTHLGDSERSFLGDRLLPRSRESLRRPCTEVREQQLLSKLSC